MPANSAPFGHLLQLLPEAVVQTDAMWNITYLNPAWQKLTGHPLDGTLGSSLLDFVHPDDTGILRSGMPVFRLRFARFEDGIAVRMAGRAPARVLCARE